MMLLHLSAVSAASVRSNAIFREACGWSLIGRRMSGFACWFKDTQYIAASKKIRMTAETSIRLAPQVDFTIAVMMGEHAAVTCFDGAHSCTCWLLLHGQCVLVSPHPICNFVILTVSCREMCVSQIIVGVEPESDCLNHDSGRKSRSSVFLKNRWSIVYTRKTNSRLTSSINQIGYLNSNYVIPRLKIKSKNWTNELRPEHKC